MSVGAGEGGGGGAEKFERGRRGGVGVGDLRRTPVLARRSASPLNHGIGPLTAPCWKGTTAGVIAQGL